MKRAAFVVVAAAALAPARALAQSVPTDARCATDARCDRDAPDADRPPPFAYPKFVRTLAGVGGAPRIPTLNVVVTAEVGGRPLRGAFGTGVSFSYAMDATGQYTVFSPGIFAKLDLTHVFLGGFWAIEPPSDFPLRLQVGSRFGADVSESFQRSPFASTYALIRPELQSFVDVEVPIDAARTLSVVVRGALDTSVNLGDLFRWSASVGLAYGWSHG
jgi:hypothetical protein